MANERSRDGQGSVRPRLLAGGTRVWDAWAPTMSDPQTGEKIRPAKRGFKSEREAWNWIAKQITDNTNGIKVLSRRGGATVQQCLDGWAETSPLKESTIVEYSKTFRTVAADLIGPTPIASIRQSDIDRMISTLHKEGKAVTRLAHLMIVLKHVWAYAKSAGHVNTNIITESPWNDRLFRDMRNQKAARDEEKDEEGIIPVLFPAQVQALLESERRPYLRTLWDFIVSTGMRRGETLALRWEDLYLDEGYIWIRLGVADTDGKIIHLETPKGNRRRKIYIDSTTVDLLKGHRETLAIWRSEHGDRWEEHNLVFPLVDARTTNKYPPGHWMMPSNLSTAYYRRATNLKFGSTKLHGLRFTWASSAYAAGVDIKTIQDHLGHRLDITTLVYVHPDQDTKREAVTRVVDHLRGI